MVFTIKTKKLVLNKLNKMHNKIRKIVIADCIPHTNDGVMTGNLLPMNLVVGTEHTIVIDSEKVKRKITSIVLVKDVYQVWLANGSEVQLWIEQPKNDKVKVEYYID